MRLVFLGRFSELAPPEMRDLEKPRDVESLADLKAWVARAQPQLGQAMQNTPVRLVINHNIAHDLLAAVHDSDEVAFLPPMSGG